MRTEEMPSKIEELERICEWLVENVRSEEDHMTCPYFLHFDKTQICPFWTDDDDGYPDTSALSIREWNTYVFELGGGCYINCATDPKKCWMYAAREAVKGSLSGVMSHDWEIFDTAADITPKRLKRIRAVAEADMHGADGADWDREITPAVVLALCEEIISLEREISRRENDLP